MKEYYIGISRRFKILCTVHVTKIQNVLKNHKILLNTMKNAETIFK